jgi:hypothetical protein
MRLMSDVVLPASRSMEDNIRSSLDEGGERYTTFRRICSLYCGALHLKLACMYGIFVPYMFLESNYVVKESNRCYIFNMISKHLIRNTTKFKTA